jgi:hypothetical protein
MEAARERGWLPEGATYNDIFQHNMEPVFGWTHKQMLALLSSETYRRARPFDGPMLDLSEWQQRGAEIHYITARSEEYLEGVEAITHRMLQNYDLAYAPERVHFYSPATKADHVQRLGLDLYVEDDTLPICDLRGRGMWLALAMAQPWNAEFDGQPWRVNWEGVAWWVDWLFRADGLREFETMLDTDDEMLKADGFEGAFLGVCRRFGQQPIIAYSRELCVETLMRRDGMDDEEADDFFCFNVLGAWVGEGTPAFIETSPRL